MTLLRDFKGLYSYSYVSTFDNKENFEIGVLDVE